MTSNIFLLNGIFLCLERKASIVHLESTVSWNDVWFFICFCSGLRYSMSWQISRYGLYWFSLKAFFLYNYAYFFSFLFLSFFTLHCFSNFILVTYLLNLKVCVGLGCDLYCLKYGWACSLYIWIYYFVEDLDLKRSPASSIAG